MNNYYCNHKTNLRSQYFYKDRNILGLKNFIVVFIVISCIIAKVMINYMQQEIKIVIL